MQLYRNEDKSCNLTIIFISATITMIILNYYILQKRKKQLLITWTRLPTEAANKHFPVTEENNLSYFITYKMIDIISQKTISYMIVNNNKR